jgi:hypothetical protein
VPTLRLTWRNGIARNWSAVIKIGNIGRANGAADADDCGLSMPGDLARGQVEAPGRRIGLRGAVG